jgi:hypothetical protein
MKTANEIDATEKKLIQRSVFWYTAVDGSVRKAADLLDALLNARDGYYLLGDYCGRCNMPLSGNIWHIGTNAIDTIAQFANVKFTTHEQLVKDFYRECGYYAYWTLMPTNRETCDAWSCHTEREGEIASASYVVRNQIAVFDPLNTDMSAKNKHIFWYRYKPDSGMIKKAKSMSEMLNNAQPDYYMLGVSCGEGKYPVGQIRAMGTDVYQIFNSLVTEVGDLLFEDFKITSKRMLVREFNDLCGSHSIWVLSPVSREDYIQWLSGKNKNGFAFVKRGWKAEIIKDCCEFCNV